MERNILIFIEDANGNQVNGVDVDFFVNGASTARAVSAPGRASIQVKDASAQIEVRIAYKGHTDSVILAQGQDSYTFTLPIPIVADGPWYKDVASGLVGLLLVALVIYLGGKLFINEEWIEQNPLALLGTIFILIGVVVEIFIPHSTKFLKQLVMILVSLGAGGLASIIPGFISVDVSFGTQLAVSAAGALAVFVIIYFVKPKLHSD